MYADFFGFRELPFNNTPDPRFFYSTPDHEEALASLIYAVKERKGFVLLTGEVGAGKTLVTRMMLAHFGTHLAFATINHAVQSPEDLMESICTEFELCVESRTSATQLVRTFHDFLLARFAQNTPVVLVLDEAQNLPLQRFEQLRMIGNLEADDAKLLQVAIVGQPELRRMFLSPELCQLRQRIFRSFHIPALSSEATEGYIRHRLSVVIDGSADIFGKDAIEAIYDFSRGVPRIINTVCDNALLSAYSAGRRSICGSFIESVIAQMMIVDSPQWRQCSTSEPQAQARGSPRFEGPRSGGSKVSTFQPPREDLTRRFSAELATLKRDVHSCGGRLSKVDEAIRRLAAVERRLGGATGDLAEARAIHASLKPLVEGARSIVSRAKAASMELERRDQELRKLAGASEGLIHDLTTLLDRAHETAARTEHAESRARAIHDRLGTQSGRSYKLADELGRIVECRLSNVDCKVPAFPIDIRQSTIDIHHPPVSNPCSKPTDTKRMQQLLQNTRESLSNLRILARGTDNVPQPFLQKRYRTKDLAGKG